MDMVLANLLMGFITILVGTTLMPEIANQINGALFHNSTTRTNVTGASATILGLVTLFFALGVMAIGVSVAVQGLKEAGIM